MRRTMPALSLTIALIALTAVVAMEPATPDPSASAAACPVTRPNGNGPAGWGEPGGYGNDALWTNLFIWGEGPVSVQLDTEHPGRTHGPGKWAWYRYVPGELTIEGRRLDGDAPPLVAHIPAGYGPSGFQVSGLDFPTTGCWEVTGHVGDATLTFVVLVALTDPTGPPAPGTLAQSRTHGPVRQGRDWVPWRLVASADVRFLR